MARRLPVNERCRNCGLHHLTQHCPSYGPMFPGPGKTAADYTDVWQKIQDLVAADIIAEHEPDEGPALANDRGGRRRLAQDAVAEQDSQEGGMAA